MKRRQLVNIHRWLGLIAGAWLLTLGITGIFLDHDDWRWLRQAEVPENWLSPSMMRYLPATVMRYVAAHPADINQWIGGSERGLWITDNRGATWSKLAFPNGRQLLTPHLSGFSPFHKGQEVIEHDARDR